MKAVIVDLQGKSAAALCEDGTFREIPDIGYALGQTIELQASLDETADYAKEAATASESIVKLPAAEGTRSAADNNNRARRGKRFMKMQFSRIAAAAAACFLVMGIGAGTVWAMPYGTVYVDNGSSLAYTINRFDYVLNVDAEDESGEKLIEELNLKKIVNRKIDRAVEETLQQLENAEEGTLSTADSAQSREIEILTDIKNEKHAKNIQERLEKITASAARDGVENTSNNPEENTSGNNMEKGTPAGENNPLNGDNKNPEDEKQNNLNPGDAKQDNKNPKDAKQNNQNPEDAKQNNQNPEDVKQNTINSEDAKQEAGKDLNNPSNKTENIPASDSGISNPPAQNQQNQEKTTNQENSQRTDTAGSSPSGQAPSGTPGRDQSGLPGDSGASDQPGGQSGDSSQTTRDEGVANSPQESDAPGRESVNPSGTEPSGQNPGNPSGAEPSGQNYQPQSKTGHPSGENAPSNGSA